MSDMVTELTKKLAERWLSLLVLPGALYLAVVAVAVTLGHGHGLDVAELTRHITEVAKDLTGLGSQIVLLAAILGAAATAGLLAQGLGSVIETMVLAGDWRSWPPLAWRAAAWWVGRRQTRWDTADRDHRAELRKALHPDPARRPNPAARHRAARIRGRISLLRPERPTWSGDRIHAIALRLDAFHLDLAPLWPHLWTVLPEPVRADVTTARANLSRAFVLGAWAVLYAPLAWWWWPAAPIALVLGLTAWRRVRASADSYAGLVEAAARVHAVALAVALGMAERGPLDPELGEALTRHLG
ncbi:hypothetical protein [Streptosporangium sp. LJ11]|uniref:hypothetical protein n=1 Tax=Streptosporangium sp. LJ11 TaxID=3436927 RepID=UPI003F7977F9